MTTAETSRPSDPIQDARVSEVLRRMEVLEEERWRLRKEREDENASGDGPWSFPENGFPIGAEQGELLYLIGRAIGARRAVEFATSLGFSTIYLAAMVRDNGGGLVTGTELLPVKVAEATANLEAAGLAEFAEIRTGDARETLRTLEGPIDLVLIDGWPTGETPTLAMQVFELIVPHLRPGSVILNDNGEEDFLAYVRNPANGFRSMTLPLHHGSTELSVRV